jgi:hypothetical protein
MTIYLLCTGAGFRALALAGGLKVGFDVSWLPDLKKVSIGLINRSCVICLSIRVLHEKRMYCATILI